MEQNSSDGKGHAGSRHSNVGDCQVHQEQMELIPHGSIPKHHQTHGDVAENTY